MLNEKQINEIKQFLSESQNPIFFFDNDPDGLCSFLLLSRAYKKGKGVPIRGSPELKEVHFRKVLEFNSDYIFILDNPLVSEEFFEKAKKYNIPVIWIDHHYTENLKIPEFVKYYNPIIKSKMEGEAVTAFCYQISNNKEDLWIAVTGCISDKYIPPFYEEFKKQYPDLTIENYDNAFDLYYKAEIGKIAQIIGDGLKDKTSNVIGMIRFLLKVKSPYEVLNDSHENYLFHKRHNEIEDKKDKLIKKAIQIGNKSGKVLFFDYKGNLSISAEIANELAYKFPDKIIVVSYIKSDYANLSLRGKNIKKPFLRVIKSFEDASGGGHNNAVGGRIRAEFLEIFKKKLSDELEKNI